MSGFDIGSVMSGGFGHGGDYSSSRDRYPRATRLAMANPDLGLMMLDIADAAESLGDFIEIMWPVLEPGRRLVRGWSHDAMLEHLEAVEKGQIKKLLINVPPGWMKSMSTCVFFPAWCWGPRRKPGLRFICASYTQALTLRDNRRCRQLIADEKYQACWGDVFQIVPDQDTKGKFENDKRGWKIATSVGGVGTGERGDIFIIDDPHNVKQAESDQVRDSTLQWFTEVVPSRVNDPHESAFIVIMQRVHQSDVSGLIISRALGYDHLCLPMSYEEDHPTMSHTTLGFIDRREEDGELLWPERYDEPAVEDLKKTLSSWGGDYAVAGQLQQRPSPRGGGMFKIEDWRFYATEYTHHGAATRPAGCDDSPAVELPEMFDWVMISVDASFKEAEKKKTRRSRVSIQVVGGKGPFSYVLENVTRHMSFTQTCDELLVVDPETLEWVSGVVYEWRDKTWKVLIEDKANGSAIVDTLRKHVNGVEGINPEGGKTSRAIAIQPAQSGGYIFLPDGAPWLGDYVSEFAAFPAGDYDDQVDSLSQVLIYATENRDVIRAMMLCQ